MITLLEKRLLQGQHTPKRSLRSRQLQENAGPGLAKEFATEETPVRSSMTQVVEAGEDPAPAEADRKEKGKEKGLLLGQRVQREAKAKESAIQELRARGEESHLQGRVTSLSAGSTYVGRAPRVIAVTSFILSIALTTQRVSAKGDATALCFT